MLTLTAMVIPGSFMFFSIGTLLYTYYKANPTTLNPLLTTDQTFPQFIAGELPAGVTGLIIAGIFAASMATLSSNINSIATLISVDFYERFSKGASQKKSVRLAEWMTVVTGLLGTVLALLLSLYNIRSLLDFFFGFMALLGGGFAGIYALGMFTRRTNWQGAIIGILASIAATIWVNRYTSLHVLTYSVVSIGACIFFGYLGSYFFPKSTKSLQGLTVFDQLKKGTIIDTSKMRAH
jgi:Na+/proline symporter